ncbi:MAG TPA: 3-hydroxybutyryl-CoA dehydrogenase [Terriglobia bacterium]|nr:3-hydroxybutyryl-CoA dehydrogenase [Terriglobia bacterium]
MDIKTIGVVGAGTMGQGIAQVLLRSGYSAILCDSSAAFLAKGRERVEKGLARDVEKGRLSTDERDRALVQLNVSTDLEPVATADFIIEAVTESFAVKAQVLGELDKRARLQVSLASNTSSISITRLAAATGRPTQFLGLHFFNPVPVMKLVEVVPGLETSNETLETAERLATSLGKTPVRVNDFPGFVSNRVLMPMINEAIFAVMEGVAEPQALDAVMKLGMNHPMGPLELADFIGLDVCLDIMKVLYDGFRDSKYRPCPLLEKMVAAGRLGRKSGRGFYEYKS